MTVREALAEGGTILEEHRVPTPHLDTCLLLGHAMGISKERVLASYPDEVGTGELEAFRSLIRRRLEGIPVSYLRGVKEFYGREFLVDRRVLVPRPDTETLIDTVLDLVNREPRLRRVHDTCTGTGCIAVTLKLEMPELEVSASDISSEAEEVFLENNRRMGTSVPFNLSDLLSSVPGTFDIITANPPYLTEEEYAGMAENHWPEPETALAAGPDGLSVLRRLIQESVAHLAAKGYLVYEAAPPQFPELTGLMTEAGFSHLEVRKDLAGRDRIMAGRL